MYLAFIETGKKTTYFIRESVKKSTGESLGVSSASGERLVHRDLYDLGPSPGAWINYPGGNAWYVDQDLETAVFASCRNFDPDLFEELFWPFVRSDIKQAVEAFRNRSDTVKKKRFTNLEKETLARSIHAFDKRRTHFLKFGNMDQGPLPNMPAILFKELQEKSRDEIEQGFMAKEKTLGPNDLKSYVYTIFDLQSFFQGFLAKQMPQALDQKKVEILFLKEICRINKHLFGLTSQLSDYMVRYLIMFFDNEYADSLLLEEMERAFKSRHRSFKVPPKKNVSTAKARTLFKLSKEELKNLDNRKLTRLYRKLAREHHPDHGGSHEKFVEINNAYQTLLQRLT
jgi:DnaJ domain